MTAKKTERDLVHLAYVSSAVPGLTRAEIEAIGARSREHNSAARLTGLLLYQGDTFCSVLEGPRRMVFARMEIIITDPHHHSVRILREEDVAERRFSNWTFGALPIPPVEAGFGRAEHFLRALGEGLSRPGRSGSP